MTTQGRTLARAPEQAVEADTLVTDGTPRTPADFAALLDHRISEALDSGHYRGSRPIAEQVIRDAMEHQRTTDAQLARELYEDVAPAKALYRQNPINQAQQRRRNDEKRRQHRAIAETVAQAIEGQPTL